MYRWILGKVVLLFFCVSCLAADKKAVGNILDPDALAVKSSVSALETENGTWQKVKYGFVVDAAKKDGKDCHAVRAEWKAFTSKFSFKEPLLIGDEVHFSFCNTQERDAGEAFVFFTSKGKPQAGLMVKNSLTIGYPDGQARNRSKMSSVAKDVFKSKVGKWHEVRIVFCPSGMGGRYDLYVDKKLVKEGISYGFNGTSLTDGLTLRGCTNDKGGREVLLGSFSVKRGGQTLAEYKALNSISMDVTPVTAEVGTFFVSGKPMRFQVKINGFRPDLSARWAITPFLESGNYLKKDVKIKLDDKGVGTFDLPADTPRRVYHLETTLYLKDQPFAAKKLDFAVVSPMPEKDVDLEKEWLGIDTVELKATSKDFDDTIKFMKMLGLHWVRKKHVWGQQYKSLEEGPNMDLLKATADRLEAANIKTVEDIQGTPQWASAAPEKGSSRWKYPPAKWEWWDTYVRALVKALGNRTQYQLWCEPCSWMAIDRIEDKYPDGTQQVLTNYWTYTRKAIDEICPKAQLIGPAVSSGNMSTVDKTLRDGSWKNLNAITYHYPKWPNSPRSSNQRVLREMIRHAGKKLPQIIDESAGVGYYNLNGKKKAGPKLHMYFRYWAEGLVDRYFIYVLYAPDLHANLISKYGFKPKGGVVALQSMILRTRHAEFIGKVSLNDKLESYLYKKNGKLCVLAWDNTESDKHEPLNKVLGKVLTSSSHCYDAYGNTITDRTVPMTDMPVYVEGVDASSLGDVLVQLRPVELRLDSDIALPIPLTIANLKNEPVEVNVALNDKLAAIAPESLSVKLEPYQVIRKDITIRPRDAKESGFSTSLIHADVNGKKESIGFAQYCDVNALKVFDLGRFAEAGQWKHDITGKSGATDAVTRKLSPTAGSVLTYRTVKKADGSVRGLFAVNQKVLAKKPWTWENFDRAKPLTIPGVPVNLRMKLHATTDMLPSNFGLLLHFVDANDKFMKYEITPFVSPTNKHETFVVESLIDSPLTSAYRHSQANAKVDPNHLRYPLRFVGFSVNPTPQRDKKIRWVGSIEVVALELEYYDPPTPVEKTAQVYDPTPQF